jgi:hypothetical protein
LVGENPVLKQESKEREGAEDVLSPGSEERRLEEG